ncbi:MAG: prepilin-type N-terminal cleavage/methylation domain-containing protein [Gammaproteobacteria bacterium]|nr:prepilin-type N-terminal cleavage/methylation domain-containing protein [Gammaproteobacteria bacterium]
MLRPVHHRASGFSLVELMISIAVGLLVLAGVTTMFAHNVKASGDTLKMARLHQELQAIMSLMTRDLRRAGYWGNASSATVPGNSDTNPFTLDNPGKYGSEPDDSCITLSYDRNGDGVVTTSPSGDDERFGFRLNDGAAETRQSGADCSAGGWEDINDTVTTEITGLNFALATRSADIDGSGSGASSIVVREVTVTLSGRLRKDTTVSRTLQDTVRVHNDLYQP